MEDATSRRQSSPTSIRKSSVLADPDSVNDHRGGRRRRLCKADTEEEEEEEEEVVDQYVDGSSVSYFFKTIVDKCGLYL